MLNQLSFSIWVAINMVNLVHNWSEPTDGTGAVVRAIASDYRKAFDLIDHNILISKWSNYGINPHIVNWICDFLSNWSQRVKLANDSQRSLRMEISTCWHPARDQITVGPWLFLIMIEDLEILSLDGTVKFVDDTTAYEIIPCRDQSSSSQKRVDEVATWSSVNKFQLHPKNCKEMRISFSRSIPECYLTDIIETVSIGNHAMASTIRD